MTTRDNGGPAYPRPYSSAHNGNYASPQTGMSLRDAFAIAALQGILSCPSFRDTPGATAEEAWRYADAMLAERAKP